MHTYGDFDYSHRALGSGLAETPLLTHRFPDAQHDGDYYQPGDAQEIERRRSIISQHAQNGSLDRLTVGDLQHWAEIDWLRPHGTYDAADYLSGKFHEEGQNEFLSETSLLPRSEAVEPNVDPANSKSEIADASWVFWATASNSGVDLESALASRFGLEGPVTLQTVHQIVTGGPGWVPSWVGVDPEEFGSVFADTDEMSADLLISDIELQIMVYNNQLFRNGVHTPQDAPEWLQQDVTDRYVDDFLVLAYLAHQWSHSSLPEIAGLAFDKLSQRAANLQIDKRSRSKP